VGKKFGISLSLGQALTTDTDEMRNCIEFTSIIATRMRDIYASRARTRKSFLGTHRRTVQPNSQEIQDQIDKVFDGCKSPTLEIEGSPMPRSLSPVRAKPSVLTEPINTSKSNIELSPSSVNLNDPNKSLADVNNLTTSPKSSGPIIERVTSPNSLNLNDTFKSSSTEHQSTENISVNLTSSLSAENLKDYSPKRELSTSDSMTSDSSSFHALATPKPRLYSQINFEPRKKPNRIQTMNESSFSKFQSQTYSMPRHSSVYNSVLDFHVYFSCFYLFL